MEPDVGGWPQLLTLSYITCAEVNHPPAPLVWLVPGCVITRVSWCQILVPHKHVVNNKLYPPPTLKC